LAGDVFAGGEVAGDEEAAPDESGEVDPFASDVVLDAPAEVLDCSPDDFFSDSSAFRRDSEG
jgi:hypothetical protein